MLMSPWKIKSKNPVLLTPPTHPDQPTPPIQPSQPPSSQTTAYLDSMCASWTQANKTLFLEFLQDHSAESGDGLNFKGATWTIAAMRLGALRTKGGVKTPLACKNKWNSMSFTPVSLTTDN
jgi:hypothetical protein